MTALPEHPATSRLALFAECGELVVAIDAMAILEIRRVEDTPARDAGGGMAMLELDGGALPGWDLGELLGVGPCASAWVIAQVPGAAGPIAFRTGRCAMVQALPLCRRIPPAIFDGRGARGGAITAGFSTAAIPELADRASGVVIDLGRVLGDDERARSAGPGRAALPARSGRTDPGEA